MNKGEILKAASDVLNEEIKTAFEAQGHTLSGAWEDSLHTEISGDIAIGYALYYGSIVNQGVSPQNIPYGGTKTGAKTSQYIQGFYNYFKARGFDDKEALSITFATAKVQKKEGMSTEASRRFSQSHERQHYVEYALLTTKSTEIVNNEMCPFVLESSNFGTDIIVII